MQYCELGSTGLRISIVGLGCSRLGSVSQSGGDVAALRLLAEALDKGITFFDTADIYGQGLSEKLLGKAIRSKRDQVVIATKAGYCISPMGTLARRLKPLLRQILRVRPSLTRTVQKVRASQSQQDFSREYLVRAVEASLSRLRVHTIDFFQLHSPPAEILERGDVFAVLEAFKQQGKIRYYGVACAAAEHVPLALKHDGVAGIQVELNLLTLKALDSVLPLARVKKTAVVARQIFASGLLLRSSESLQPEHCSNRSESFEQLKGKLRQLEQLATEAHTTVPELGLRFLQSTEGLSNMLIGTTSVQHLQENLEMVARPPLERVERSRLAEIIGASDASGT
jgi:aryl-alcohol dehydrogenase-like predicted oxidoreductase